MRQVEWKQPAQTNHFLGVSSAEHWIDLETIQSPVQLQIQTPSTELASTNHENAHASRIND
jgi:hypothetical protein